MSKRQKLIRTPDEGIYKDDIVDDLTSTDTDKPLSANQGKQLQDTKVAKDGDTMGGDLNFTGERSIGTTTADSFSIKTNNVNRVTVDNSGRVGIGTSSLFGSLRVAGTSANSFPNNGGFIYITDTNAGTRRKNWGIQSSDGLFAIIAVNDTFTGAQGVYTITRDGELDRAADHIWFTGASVERMRLNSSGLTIAGSLSKGSGSFKIDHPLKPDTHHLVHSFIEAPQADLIYRGKVSLKNGKATVNVDEAGRMTEGTFVALNCNVQCFTNNESGWTPVRGSVSGNILTIEAQDKNCNDEISWMVIGERCDQHMIDTDWTDENGRVITEPLKKQN